MGMMAHISSSLFLFLGPSISFVFLFIPLQKPKPTRDESASLLLLLLYLFADFSFSRRSTDLPSLDRFFSFSQSESSDLVDLYRFFAGFHRFKVKFRYFLQVFEQIRRFSMFFRWVCWWIIRFGDCFIFFLGLDLDSLNLDDISRKFYLFGQNFDYLSVFLYRICDKSCCQLQIHLEIVSLYLFIYYIWSILSFFFFHVSIDS